MQIFSLFKTKFKYISASSINRSQLMLDSKFLTRIINESSPRTLISRKVIYYSVKRKKLAIRFTTEPTSYVKYDPEGIPWFFWTTLPSGNIIRVLIKLCIKRQYAAWYCEALWSENSIVSPLTDILEKSIISLIILKASLIIQLGTLTSKLFQSKVTDAFFYPFKSVFNVLFKRFIASNPKNSGDT